MQRRMIRFGEHSREARNVFDVTSYLSQIFVRFNCNIILVIVKLTQWLLFARGDLGQIALKDFFCYYPLKVN